MMLILIVMHNLTVRIYASVKSQIHTIYGMTRR